MCCKTYSFFIRELCLQLFNESGFKLFSRSVRVFDGRSFDQILEFNGGLGCSSGLLHNGESKYLVRFTFQFDGHAIFNLGRVDGHSQGCRRNRNDTPKRHCWGRTNDKPTCGTAQKCKQQRGEPRSIDIKRPHGFGQRSALDGGNGRGVEAEWLDLIGIWILKKIHSSVTPSLWLST